MNSSRSVLIGIFFLIAPLAKGQKEAVIKARNLLDQDELMEAKSYIDRASKNESTAEEARTWYYRGKVHYRIFRSQEEAHREYVDSHPTEVPFIAVSSYVKALELDEKGKFEREIEKELPVLKSALLNQGVKAFNERNYEDAFKAFDSGTRAGELLNDGKPVDTLAYFNAGLAARQVGKNNKALEHFERSIELGHEAGKSYFIASRIHKERGDMEEAFRMVQEGRKAHPGMRKLVLEELDHMLRREEFQSARKSLEKTIEENPGNPVLHFSLGTVYDRLYQKSDTMPEEIGGKDSSLFKASKSHYEKAIELDSAFHSAYYSLGALFYNRGADLLNQANQLKDRAKYEEEIDEAEKDLERARPYLEKALEIEPKDRQTLISLRNLYSRQGKEEKVEELKERLDN